MLVRDDEVILGSASPRRQELLASLGVDFRVFIPDFLEVPWPEEKPWDYVGRNARGKALAVRASRLNQKAEGESERRSLIISADTIVELEGLILEKPRDSQEAFSMLTALAGKTHRVHTGLCCHLYEPESLEPVCKTLVVTTEVTFKTLGTKEKHRYIATGEPFDKAGGYGIQGYGAYLVKHVAGSYTNVMGLPLAETYEILNEWQILREG